jgi:heme/copper-type cytochrome/quinol oxidase subunit 4
MSIANQPLHDQLSDAVRGLWPERTPSYELRTRTLFGATAAMRHAQASRAKPKAQQLAITTYVCGFILILLTLLGFSSAWQTASSPLLRWVIFAALALCGVGACTSAILFAARWCQVMRLPREMRWVPLASLVGVLAIIVGVMDQSSAAARTQDVGAQDQAALPTELQNSMNLVSSALTRTMTISESQAWLNSRLPENVERAWFVTPEGLVALSSITTVNEISRSVMDYIAITQTYAAQNAGLSYRELSALASLQGHETLTRAMVMSNTPALLLVMVKQALLNASATPHDAHIYTELIPNPDGSLAGIIGVTWLPSAQGPISAPLLLITIGFVMIGLAWATWVYLVERERFRSSRSSQVHPWRWALITGLIAPVGLLAYLFNRSEES